MLYLVGLGLGDEKDITVKGLEIVRKCHKVYLEHYTSILTVGKDALERYVSCNIQFFLHPPIPITATLCVIVLKIGFQPLSQILRTRGDFGGSRFGGARR